MAIHCAARLKYACVTVISDYALAFIEDRMVTGIAVASGSLNDEGQVLEDWVVMPKTWRSTTAAGLSSG